MEISDYILQLIRVRSSCRHFKKDAKLTRKEKDILLRSIDMGPSAGGLYSYSIYHSESEKSVIQRFSLDQKQIGDCSLVFLICSKPDPSVEKYGERGKLYSIQDATIAGMNITIAATSLGLGSCWIGSIDTEKMTHSNRLKPVVS